MIKIHIDEGELKGKTVEFGGTLETLCADIVFQISLVYGVIRMKNEDAAKEFKDMILNFFNDDDARAFVFSDNLAKELAKRRAVCIHEEGKDDSPCEECENKKKESILSDEDKEKLIGMFKEMLDL